MRGEDAPLLGEVLGFMRLLWGVAQQLESTSRWMELSMGVTGPQRLVLRLVGRFPGITASGLARILHLHASSLTGVLKRLEQRGYIARKVDPLDGRRGLIFLTEAGQALSVPSSGTVESAVERLLARVSEAQLAATRDVLIALAEALAEGQAPPDDASR